MPLSIRIVDIQNFNPNQPIYLHDKHTDSYHDLSQNDYNTNLEAGNYQDRYEITFTNSTLNVEEIDNENLFVLQNASTSGIEIHNPSLLHIVSFTLYDTNGKLILQSELLDINKKYAIDIPALNESIYFITIKLNDSRVINKKIKLLNFN